MSEHGAPRPLPGTVSSDGARRVLMDADLVAELRALGSDEFTAIVELFLDDGATTVAALRAAHAAGDTTEIARLAHSLKGIASTFGSETLVASCVELRRVAGDLVASGQCIDVTATELALAGEALRLEMCRVPACPDEDRIASVSDKVSSRDPIR
jgi:HPt (histidine-containing phosphotransfer) domain-containing protein